VLFYVVKTARFQQNRSTIFCSFSWAFSTYKLCTNYFKLNTLNWQFFIVNLCFPRKLLKQAHRTAERLINYRLIHGHFHIGLVIIPRPPYWPETQIRDNMGRGMITKLIWKCPCFKLFITYFRHLEKRHPYWPETKSRPILAQANMGLDMEMIL
jgi:hypothetical protein